MKSVLKTIPLFFSRGNVSVGVVWMPCDGILHYAIPMKSEILSVLYCSITFVVRNLVSYDK